MITKQLYYRIATVAVSLALISAAACNSCDSSKKTPEASGKPSGLDSAIEASSGSAKSGAQQTNEDPSQKLIDEVNHYTECLNNTMNTSEYMMERYAVRVKWFAENGGACKLKPDDMFEGYDPRVSRVTGVLTGGPKQAAATCEKAVQRSKLDPSLPELEKGIEELSKPYSATVKVFDEIEDYYNQQNYKDDQCAKGVSMHKDFIEGMNLYKEAEKSLQPKMDQVRDKIDEEQLLEVEKRIGKKMTWHNLQFENASKKLMHTLPSHQPIETLKIEDYINAFQKLEEAYNALETYTKAHPNASSDLETIKTFYTQAKLIKRVLDQDKNVSKIEEYQWDALIRYYNSIVENKNRAKNLLRGKGLTEE